MSWVGHTIRKLEAYATFLVACWDWRCTIVLGIAGGREQGLLFRHGKVVCKVPQAELADLLVAEAWKMVAAKQAIQE